MAPDDEVLTNPNESLLRWVHLLAMALFISAFLVALSRALIRFQPWAGVCMSSLFAFLSGWGFDWFVPKLRHRKGYDSAERRNADAASVGFLVTAAACLSAIFLSRAAVLWLALALFVMSLGMLYMVVRLGFGGIRAIRALWREVEDGPLMEVKAATNARGLSDDTGTYLPHVAGVVVTSGIYFLVFFPLAACIASARGSPLIDMLLLIDVSNAAAGLGLMDSIRLVVSDPAFYVPLGVYYSVAGMIVVFFLSLKAKPIRETSSMAFGLTCGYASAVLVARWSAGQIQTPILTPSLGVAYVLLLHYGMASLAELLPTWGLRKKYDHLLSGIESMGTAYLLSRVYGPSAAIFGGAVFFAATFLATSLWEGTAGRLLKQAAPVLDKRLLVMAYGELRSLLRVKQRGNRWHAVTRELLIPSLIMVLFPVLAFLIIALCLRG